MSTLIKVDHLRKVFKRQVRSEGFAGTIKDLFYRRYTDKIAVNDISFTIDRGEIVGYIGPNGAGKSTTIKMLSGILVPTEGIGEVGGLVPQKTRKQYSRRIGVVFGQRTQLWWDIPVSESFKLLKYMYRVPDQEYKRSLELFSDVLRIDEFISAPVRQLSLGQRMRADLCAALLHNPDILYLDEPTIGLDVVVKENIRDFIRQVNQERKTTVILTTHDMSDIEKLCSRVIVIDHGKIMYDGALGELKNIYGTGETMVIEAAEPVRRDGLSLPGIADLACDGKTVTIKYDKTVVNSTAILKTLMNKITITDFVVHPSDIEQIIRKMYENPLPAAEAAASSWGGKIG